MRKRNLLLLVALSLSLCTVAPAALAHEEGDVHDAVHDQLDAQHQQVHDLVNAGVISPQEHAALDARLGAEHQAFHNQQDYSQYNNGYNNNGYYNNGYNGNNGYTGYFNNGYNRNNNWAHRREHVALNRAHRDVHKLVNEGVISPQEHAILDNQLRAEHDRADAVNGFGPNPNLQYRQTSRWW